ncbi:hypothetical protein R3P38DRAFT_3211693 [Favolaschia claudopus]|uniref:ER transporter 6TM N-terminal domain-containing protein n=1 Tax=Favolaschia claudopus TaxID=2862362 RepID=A0AAW0AFB8_9AGAR
MSAGSSTEPDDVKRGGDGAVAIDSGKSNVANDKPSAMPAFFSWLIPAIRNRRTLKTFIRCLLVSAAALVLLVDRITLINMGQAAFFASIVAFLLPPSMALSVFLLASITLLLGMLIGWAWAAATMAAALSVQDKAQIAARMAAAQKNLVPGIPPAFQIQTLIFHGEFLTPGPSAVYGAMFFIGTFAFGVVRAKVPKLALLGIFGTIVLDVVCTIGPLLPAAQYTLPKMFLIPTCYYLAISLASLVLIFPESLNHVWLTLLDTAFFESALSLLSLQSEALKTRPSDHKAWEGLAGKITAARLRFGASLAGLHAQIGLIDLEISVGRLGPSDLKRLALEVRAVGFRASRLLAFQAAVTNANAEDARADAALAAAEKRQSEQEARAEGFFDPAAHGRFARRRAMVRKREAEHGHDLDRLVPILEEASAELRGAAEDGMKALREWFRGCNVGRWRAVWRGFGFGIGRTKAEERDEKERVERQERLVKARDVLAARLETWRKVGRVRLIEPFERFFDGETGRLKEGIGRRLEDPGMFAVRSLFICFVFCDTLDAFAARVHRVLGIVAELDLRRPKPRLWWPPGFGKLGRRLLSPEPATVDQSPLAMGTSSDPTRFDDLDTSTTNVDGGDSNAGDEKKIQNDINATPDTRRNPDARPPKSALGRFSIALGGVLRFFRTPEGIFALRHAFLSLALWIPAVVRRTAWFYYAEKGLWALIMAQMGLATFAGDQLFGLATRLVGTALGLLNGMVVWYIAAPGHGTGNPYAVVIVTTVFCAPFLFARIAAPPMQMMFWTMIGVTTVFVVGYSWLDEHFSPLVSNSGIGVELGWKRAVLVMIGFTAGGIMMLFPRPTSSRVLVRRTLAATLREQGSIFGSEVEAFLAEEARARSGHFETEAIDWVDQGIQGEDEDVLKVSPKERRIRRVAHRVLVVFERLQGLAPSLQTSRWEPQVQGLWPHEQYGILYAKETNLTTSLSLIAGAFTNLDAKWCSILVHRTPFLNPNLLSDIFATIDILSNALEDGHPLPASLPCLRERLVYHESLIRSMNRNARRVDMPLPVERDEDSSDSEDSDSETHAEFVAGKVNGASIGFEELSLSVLMDEQLPTHSTAVVALGSFLSLIDEITVIVRELCGQTTYRGFDSLHQQFQGREEAAMGTYAQK